MSVESAFPQERAFWSPGMTLRDYFAAMYLEGYMSNSLDGFSTREDVAREAYKMADAMLEARK